MNETSKKIAQDFRDLAAANPKLSAMLKKLNNGKADYLDADKYALELAQALGKALQLNLGEGKLSGETYREVINEVLPPGLYDIYDDVASFAQTIQKGINERAKMGLNAVKSEFNGKEVDNIVKKATSVSTFDNIPGGINNDLMHMAQNVATDTMKANAKLANDVGMEAVVTRIYDGVGVHTQKGGKYKKACKWCLDRCGVNVPYPDAIANDMFRRHPGCGCVITYTVNGKMQVQSDWRSNQWTDVDPKALKQEEYKSRGKDVTKRYRQEADPGRGFIEHESGFDKYTRSDEAAMATHLHKILGGDISCLAEKQGQKNPDYRWQGSFWELKTTSTPKSANSAIEAGMKQIRSNPGGIILDYGNNHIDIDETLKVIDKRMEWYPKDIVDIMIISNGEMLMVLRY